MGVDSRAWATKIGARSQKKEHEIRPSLRRNLDFKFESNNDVGAIRKYRKFERNLYGFALGNCRRTLSHTNPRAA
jgi:hypothetical protein